MSYLHAEITMQGEQQTTSKSWRDPCNPRTLDFRIFFLLSSLFNAGDMWVIYNIILRIFIQNKQRVHVLNLLPLQMFQLCLFN